MDMELIDKTGVLIVNKLQWHRCQVSGLLHEVCLGERTPRWPLAATTTRSNHMDGNIRIHDESGTPFEMRSENGS